MRCVCRYSRSRPAFDQLCPGDGRVAAARVYPDDRPIDAAPVLAAFQPVVKGALRDAEQPRRLRFGEHLPVQNVHAHAANIVSRCLAPGVVRTDILIAKRDIERTLAHPQNRLSYARRFAHSQPKRRPLVIGMGCSCMEP